MGVFYETVPKSLQKWILSQKVLWVASAPLAANGHINVSPKGGEYFGIVDEKTFWYMDLTGSGIETTSHLHEPGNGRITVMFNAFEGAPKIVRLWGKGVVLEAGTTDFKDFVNRHAVQTIPGTRSIVVVHIHQVGSSCGFSMPFYDFKGMRPTLNEFFAKKAEKEAAGDEKESIERYWAYKNALSIDNLPGMHKAVEVMKAEKIQPIKKMVGLYATSKPRRRPALFSAHTVVLVALLCFFMGVALAAYGPVLLQEMSDRNSSLQPALESLRRSVRKAPAVLAFKLERR